ncbi:MAG: hypothetical protein JNL01_16350 [Bdellovibrionales bacterium]|nr:hypothetical protein [Bdellovibrionales bacterium]
MNTQLKRTSGWIVALTAALMVSGCGRGSNKNVKIDGVDGPRVNFVDNKFTMALTLTQVQFDVGTRIPIPKLPNSYVEVGPDFATNGLLISIGIDARDLVAMAGGQAALLDPTTLPGGRPLPGVAAGELPGLAVQVPKWNDIVFYLGTALFGVFVPVNLPWKDYMGTFRFYDGAGDRIGNLSIVGQDSNGRNSGVLLLINLAGKVGKLAGLQ